MKQTITYHPIHPHHTQDYEQAGLKIILLENRPYVQIGSPLSATIYEQVRQHLNDTTALDDQIDRAIQRNFAAFRRSIGITKLVSIIGRWLHATTLFISDFAPLQLTKADYHRVIRQRYGDLYEDAIQTGWRVPSGRLPDATHWWLPERPQIPRVRFDPPKLPKRQPTKELSR